MIAIPILSRNRAEPAMLSPTCTYTRMQLDRLPHFLALAPSRHLPLSRTNIASQVVSSNLLKLYVRGKKNIPWAYNKIKVRSIFDFYCDTLIQ